MGSSAAELFPLVYDELRKAARRQLQSERTGHTLQPTALVHEVFVKLSKSHRSWRDEAHFYLAAAEAMRLLLVDHARARNAQKRGGGRPRDLGAIESIADIDVNADGDLILDLSAAIGRLETSNARVADVVKLRTFDMLSSERCAELLKVSKKTVDRDWAYGRAWLLRELGSTEDASEAPR